VSKVERPKAALQTPPAIAIIEYDSPCRRTWEIVTNSAGRRLHAAGSAHVFRRTTGGKLLRTWTLDPRGNWLSTTTNGVAQTRTHNAVNEITDISGDSPDPNYDEAGNLPSPSRRRSIAMATGRLRQAGTIFGPRPTEQTKGGLIVVGRVNPGGSVEMIPNPVPVAEFAVEKGPATLLMPFASPRQLFEVPDEMGTKVSIEFYTDSPDALLKAIVD